MSVRFDMDEFGRRLKTARQVRGLELTQLSFGTGLDLEPLALIERAGG